MNCESSDSCSILKRSRNRIQYSSSAYLFWAFTIPVALTFLSYVCLNVHPFGESSVLVLDLNGQYVYFFESLRNAIYGEGSFLYTFSRALGGEYMGIYAYYLASPLSYIVALFPQDMIIDALFTIILLKVGICGLTFGFYLHKKSAHPNKVAVVSFSVMYAMCAYVVVYQNNLMWLDAVFWLPIITYAIEQLVLNKRYKLFVISLALSIMSNYYIGYMTCIWCVLYFIYFYASTSPGVLNPQNERRHFVRSGVRFGVSALTAAAISAVILLLAFYSLKFGKTDFTSPSWSLMANFNVFDFFTKFLPGAYDTVRPEGLPFVYCGVLTLILLPVYFFSKSIRITERLASLSFVAFLILCFVARPADLVWHGFQNPNWLNYRYSFMLCFLLLVLGYKALGNIRKCNKYVVAVTCVMISLFALVCRWFSFDTYVVTEEKLSTFGTVVLTVLLSAAFLIILSAWMKAKDISMRDGVSAVLASVVCIEMMLNAAVLTSRFNDDVRYSEYDGYNSFISELRPVVDQVNALDSSFYRMEKLVYRKFNDNMALGIRGLSNSTSTLNASTIGFLSKMGYVADSNFSNYQGGNPVNDSLLGIKYVIARSNANALKYYYDEVISNEKYDVFQNPYALSLAYGVSDSVKTFDMNAYKTYFDRLNSLVGALNGYEQTPEIFKPVSNYKKSLNSCTEEQLYSMTTYVADQEETASEITFEFVAPYTGDYYFHTPTPDRDTCLLEINGRNIGDYLGSDRTSIFSLGHFRKGAEVKVKISFFASSFSIENDCDYIWYIDKDNFEASFADLKDNPQLVIDEGFTDDHLTGTLTTVDERTNVLTTIPFDKGWNVYVDGEKTEIYQTLDALIAFDVDGVGEHTVELKYSPIYFKLGLIVSIFGTLIFAAAVITEAILKKKSVLSTREDVESYWTLEDFEEDHALYLSSLEGVPEPQTEDLNDDTKQT